MFERPILIYSNYCKYSTKFLDVLMSNTELFQTFIRVNIDIDPKTKTRPSIFYEVQEILNFKITEVPTIIVNNAEYILSGENAFNWLNDVLTPVQQKEKELAAFNPIEMGGFSDKYANYGVSDMHENTAEQCFIFLDKKYDDIPTPQDDGNNISSSDYTKKQQERETFDNIKPPGPKVQMNNYKPNSMMNNINTNQKNNNFNFGKDNASQKQKDMDSKYQELLQEREKLNTAISRV